MMLPLYVVDAFAAEPFTGNPAGVVLLPGPFPSERWMQAVAAEMKHAETAFIAPGNTPAKFQLRWFTPTAEVDLCGHATLASAHVLFEHVPSARALQDVTFSTRSGDLLCAREGSNIKLVFPALQTQPVSSPPNELLPALGIERAVFVGRTPFDYLVEVDSADQVVHLTPDIRKLAAIDARGIIVCARYTARETADAPDIVSRFFAPRVGVDEDPVTGSTHCALAPHFGRKLGRTEFVALQASPRSGIVRTRWAGDQVELRGKAITFLRGEIHSPPAA